MIEECRNAQSNGPVDHLDPCSLAEDNTYYTAIKLTVSTLGCSVLSALQLLRAAKRAEMKKNSVAGAETPVDMVSRDELARGEVVLVYDEC